MDKRQSKREEGESIGGESVGGRRVEDGVFKFALQQMEMTVFHFEAWRRRASFQSLISGFDRHATNSRPVSDDAKQCVDASSFRIDAVH